MKNSSQLLDEPTLIATIRTVMRNLEQLAIQWGKNHSEQWEVYSKDITAPTKPGRFNYLSESQTRINQEYTILECDTIKQMSYYDAFCEHKGIPYSNSWNLLLTELRSYLSGPSALSMSLR
jgi:hypothetical protein